MHQRLDMTRLLAGACLILPLLLGGCSIFDDDDDGGDAPEVTGVSTQPATTESEETPGEATETSGETAAQATGEDQDGDEAEDDSGDSDEDLVTVVEEITEEVRPAVAFIAITQVQQSPTGGQNEQQGVGSGVIFSEDGHILTNNHVVEAADELSVVLPDGRQFDATVIGRAPQEDLAVIQIEGEDLPVATLAEGGDLNIGEWVIAIGNALGLEGGASVTVGVVSALDRTLRPGPNEPPMEGLIQTDAAINPGNSGGPLLNLDGEVVGINTAKLPQAEGIGFAVPIETAHTIIEQILTGEPRAALGVTVSNVTPELALRFGLPLESGVLVVDIDTEGAAAAAGIQVGDIIVGIDDQQIENLDQLRSALDEYEPGDTVTVTVNREGEEQQFDVELGESLVIQ